MQKEKIGVPVSAGLNAPITQKERKIKKYSKQLVEAVCVGATFLSLL